MCLFFSNQSFAYIARFLLISSLRNSIADKKFGSNLNINGPSSSSIKVAISDDSESCAFKEGMPPIKIVKKTIPNVKLLTPTEFFSFNFIIISSAAKVKKHLQKSIGNNRVFIRYKKIFKKTTGKYRGFYR